MRELTLDKLPKKVLAKLKEVAHEKDDKPDSKPPS